jgi:hypothetical protein
VTEGGWSISRHGRFTLRKIFPIPIKKEDGWISEQAWTLWEIAKFLIPAGKGNKVFNESNWQLKVLSAAHFDNKRTRKIHSK